MLKEFLQDNKDAILVLTERKTLELAGDHPSSAQLKEGLPSFYRQMIEIVGAAGAPSEPPPRDIPAIASAADRGDEPGMAEAANQPREAELARSAGLHGFEMLRLGYSLSHVVHAYGAMCQAITETAADKEARITPEEFHALNRSLDVAIAGAVTNYQFRKDFDAPSPEGEGERSVVHEMQSTIARAKVAFEAIQRGAVGIGGGTARSLAKSLGRLEKLIEQSLAGNDVTHPGGSASG